VSAHRVVADDGDFLGAVSISQYITERKQTAAKLEQLQRRLVDTSRSAGMAEIATNVLHNVGNALNGVNVSAGLLTSRLRRSRVEGLERLLALFEREQADLAGFLAAPGKASQVLGFLREVAGGLAAERDDMLAETASMQKNIDHIKAIVDMQQSYARHRGVIEELDIATVIDDSLQINAGACQRHGVSVQRELEATPRIVTQRHKVMQILVNLIRNAKYACDAAGVEAKRVVVRATTTPSGIGITVQDNGVGIRAEHRELLFTHGFTTKPDGHGFGLHSAALAARELGGSLTAHSDGPGLGATFTLELPLRPPESAHD
jgi:signal transduction histidine kinase